MADYPGWVLRHKVKGTYINYANGKYYLYAAHSERVPGTKKVRRICDGYLGRITEDKGLIPVKDKVSDTIRVMEYGVSSLLLIVCSNVHKGLRRTFTKNGDFVMIASVLRFIYGEYSEILYHQSFLSTRFPNLDFQSPLTEAQIYGIDRGFRMIKDTIQRVFGDDLQDILIHFGHLYKVNVNGKLYLSEETDEIKKYRQKYKIELEDVANG
jgi:hypothetical protein